MVTSNTNNNIARRRAANAKAANARAANARAANAKAANARALKRTPFGKKPLIVSFANTRGKNLVSAVHTVPHGGRGLYPGYVARMQRQQGLALHGIRVDPHNLNRSFGNTYHGSAYGKRGAYSNQNAARNLWHSDQFGTPFHFKQRSPDGKFVFSSRYALVNALGRQEKVLAQMAAQYNAGTTPYSPHYHAY